MNFETFFKHLVKDIQVDLSDEFDKNFQRKAFFDNPWHETRWPVSKGSLMLRSGALRRSILAFITGDQISWRSSLPYASIHNEGGEITVTAKMKRFFWAMYRQSSNAITYSCDLLSNFLVA